jgi:hypothetical protein
VPTVLRVFLTGVFGTVPNALSVNIGSTIMLATQNNPDDLPGTDKVDFTLIPGVDTGDQPIFVTSGISSSRNASTSPPLIKINAPPPTPTPTPTPGSISSPSDFVRQQYLDFLGREPDAAGWAFWTNEITSCGTNQQCIDTKRVNVSGAFFLSIEFQQSGYLVERLYKAAYGDATGSSNIGSAHQLPVPTVRFSEFLPDARQIGLGVIVGQSGWENVLETNKQNFVNGFVQRTRFTTAFPETMSAQQFVDKLYNNVGLTPVSAINRPKAVSEFNATTPADTSARARALRDVAEDPMVTQMEFNRAFVLMQYFGYLRRNPNDSPDADYSGYDFWLAKLNAFNGDYQKAEMVKAFITSSEYLRRFGQ